jgi:uncharacterized protein
MSQRKSNISPSIFNYQTHLPHSVEQVFAWHERKGAFERLSPPWEKIKVVASSGSISDGSRVTLKVPLAFLPMEWVLEHTGYIKNVKFQDKQISGPFESYIHTHLFTSRDDDATVIEDSIEYTLLFSKMLHASWFKPFRFGKEYLEKYIHKNLKRVFTYRQRVLSLDLESHKSIKPFVCAITGSSGLVGKALSAFLTTGGHTVHTIKRSEKKYTFQLEPSSNESLDAVVHLAGESIIGIWTEKKRREILESRVQGTRNFIQLLKNSKRIPKVFIAASAIGYYGRTNSESEMLHPKDETCSKGEGFLSDVVKAWEHEALEAEKLGCRVVILRIGTVISPSGGFLGQLLPFFKKGLGGTIGNGANLLSWISIEDLLRIIYFSIQNEKVSGTINCVSPQVVTNKTFTKTLSVLLKVPSILPIPEKIISSLFGDLGKEVILSSQNVYPKRLEELGYEFIFKDIGECLKYGFGY